MTNIMQKAFAVHFAELNRWNVNSFFTIRWQWPEAVIQPLSFALERKVLPSEVSQTTPVMVTLHFDGEVVPRDISGRRSIKGRLVEAKAGDVIYSRIDVRNGAIGVIPPSIPKVAVTNEFPVYMVRRGVADPEFVKLIFRTRIFRQQLNSMVSGASGRKRVQPSDIERVKIPIPPLEIQKAIIMEWQKAKQEIASAEERIRRIESEIEEGFFSELGLKAPLQSEGRKCFATWWTDFSRWSVSHNQAALVGTDLTEGKYSVVVLGRLLADIQYGTSEKANAHGSGVTILRINNIKNRSLDLSDLKHINLAGKSLQSLLLRDGDILIIRTSGSRDLVGTCAVFHDPGPYVYASYVIRMRTDPSRANPDFVSWFINSAFGRQQINAISRQIMQNNINTGELRNLRIPLPPLEVQRRIMADVEAGRAKIASEREKARTLSIKIEEDIEAYLLGKKKVGVN